MGRLGFNLVREKDAAKNVESGLQPPDAQQNERNEGAEIGELILACERNRRTIRSLRLLSFCLAIMLMCMAAYMILSQSREYYNDQSKTEFIQDVLPEATKGALIGNGIGLLYEDTSAVVKPNDEGNCTRNVQELEVTRSELERKLETEREEREQFAREFESRYDDLQNRFNALSSQHELLANQERTQSATLEQLRQERAELIQKLEASQRKLQRSASQRAAARNASSGTTTTTTSIPPTTTTPAPQKANIFDTEQFRKINDLVKDIETGAALFDLRNFMRQTDEIFNP